MPSKTVPMSVRLSQEDAEFLAGLQLKGATTPSEKLRQLIAEARRRPRSGGDYEATLAAIEEQMMEVMHRIRVSERMNRRHSELLWLVNEWLPEMFAFIASSPEDDKAIDAETLRALESEVADRVFRLVEGVLRLGVTERAPCYDEKIVSGHLQPLRELAQVVFR